MSNNRGLLGSREVELLRFLWRWKVSTTAALTKAFFKNIAPVSAYKRIWELERDGYIIARPNDRHGQFIWTLTHKGFDVIRPMLPELKEEGYQSENLGHDLVVTALHLGNYLNGVPKDVGVFSEQELRRFHIDFYPEWVPTSNPHRPDGYWSVPTGQPRAIIAIEVELSWKKFVQYEVIADFYASEPKIARVLWLTARPSMTASLHRKIVKALGHKAMNHDFVSYPSFQQNGWLAPVELGPEKGKTIAEILGNSGSTSGQPVDSKLILDTRKTPYKSQNMKLFELG